jgi:hypothetical protein
MSDVELQGSRTVWETPPANTLGEMALLAAAVMCSYVTPYDVMVRFVVAAGAIIVMLQAFHTRNYADVIVFGALALLYNPAVPVFNFTGGWQRSAMAASAVPFVASLGWHNVRTAARLRI